MQTCSAKSPWGWRWFSCWEPRGLPVREPARGPEGGQDGPLPGPRWSYLHFRAARWIGEIEVYFRVSSILPGEVSPPQLARESDPNPPRQRSCLWPLGGLIVAGAGAVSSALAGKESKAGRRA